MNVPHDENIVVPFEERLASDVCEIVREVGLVAAIPALAVVRHADSDEIQPVRVEQRSCRLNEKRIADNRTDDSVALVVRNEEVAVRAVHVSALTSDENPIAVERDSEIVLKKAPDPDIVVAAQKVQLDAAPAGVVDCVIDVEIAIGNNPGAFEEVIENVPEKENARIIRDLLEEMPEPGSPLQLDRIVRIQKMGVREKVDPGGLQFKVR